MSAGAVAGIGVDPGWRAVSFAIVELGDAGGVASVRSHTILREEETTDSEWLAHVAQALKWLRAPGDHLSVAVEDVRGPLQAAQRMGKSSAKAQDVLLMVGACLAARGGHVQLVTPQKWREALGLPKSAEKREAWAQLRALLGGESIGRNEHERDAACIAYTGAVMLRDEL